VVLVFVPELGDAVSQVADPVETLHVHPTSLKVTVRVPPLEPLPPDGYIRKSLLAY